MNHYKTVYKVPVANYFEYINTGNPVYIAVFMQNDDDSKLDFFNPPNKFPKKFYKIAEEMEFQFEEYPVTESLINELRLQSLKIELMTKEIIEGKKPHPNTRINAEQLKNSIIEDFKNRQSLDDRIRNIEAFLGYKIIIDKFKTPFAKFIELEKTAYEIAQKSKA